jgi:hypothetical protein
MKYCCGTTTFGGTNPFPIIYQLSVIKLN